MELWKRQKKIGIAFGIFLGLMFLCTLISRAVYAGKLPQVKTERPGRMSISHTVQTEGLVSQGLEYAVNTLSGLRCRTVHAHVGDKVTEDSLLFEVDLEDLKEQIAEQELAIQKLSLTIRDQEQNRNLDAETEKREEDRAKEDYDRTKERLQGAVDRAKQDLAAARQTLEHLQQNPPARTPEAERAKALADYEIWRQEWEKEEGRLKDALNQKLEEIDKEEGKTEEEKEQERAEAKKPYEAHLMAKKEKPDFDGEDEAYAIWQQKISDLKNQIDAQGQTLSGARKDRDEALLEAERKVSDAGLPSRADSSLEINRLELIVLKEKLTKYREVLEAEGKIYPEAEGIVTRIGVSPGERIGDGAAVVYADLESPLKFQFSLSAEQKKYVNQGDAARITLGRETLDVNVDYVARSDGSPDLYEAVIFLPEGVGTLGQSGVFTVQTQSELYSSCVSIDALHVDENGRNYIYLLGEKSGILGKELAAELVYVQALDKNDRYAALDESTFDTAREVITDASQALEDGMVVRYKE